MTGEEAETIARDVVNGKTRSYVGAAIILAKYIIASAEATRKLCADVDAAKRAAGALVGEHGDKPT